MENSGFYFYEVENTYEKVLNSLATTEVYSYKTSSIPLVEFWMPKNERLSKQILEKIGIASDFNKAQKIFEYPVYSKCDDGKNIGKPSMTDLMIITKDKQVAIEAKFTEKLYCSIEEWLKSISSASKKPDVLKGWYAYIERKLDIFYTDEEKERINKHVVYQFLHRTASACSSDKKPVLIYQLFYDAFNKESKQQQIEIAEKLQEFAKIYLKFKSEKISFYIAFTPVLNLSNIEQMYSNQKSSLFHAIKTKNIYEFAIPVVIDCLKESIALPKSEYAKQTYTDEEFIQVYGQLWEETWHRGENQKSGYEKRIEKTYKDRLHGDEKEAFNKYEAEKRYNKNAGEEIDIEKPNTSEEWRCLTNPGYTRYAVSSLGRVALRTNGKYKIISQDDMNNNGYLKLDHDGKYNLDHNIEVCKLIAMGFLGKVACDGYDVHHKINDGYNCRPSNLVLLTRSQHNAVHSSKWISDLHKYFKNFS